MPKRLSPSARNVTVGDSPRARAFPLLTREGTMPACVDHATATTASRARSTSEEEPGRAQELTDRQDFVWPPHYTYTPTAKGWGRVKDAKRNARAAHTRETPSPSRPSRAHRRHPGRTLAALSVWKADRGSPHGPLGNPLTQSEMCSSRCATTFRSTSTVRIGCRSPVIEPTSGTSRRSRRSRAD